jgi:hypothetical protein
LDNKAKQLGALTEKANQQFVRGLAEEAEKTAEECLILAGKCEPLVSIGLFHLLITV